MSEMTDHKTRPHEMVKEKGIIKGAVRERSDALKKHREAK